MKDQFWKRKSLAHMSADEWESLCDGCALCCMHKIEDEDSGELFYTDVACRLLDVDTCRCTNYSQRAKLVADCLNISLSQPDVFEWLPASCAYRRLSRGEELPEWHPLLTGDPETVHAAGISMRGRVVSESDSEVWQILRKLNE
jgi:uncharacterized cysteine cluster protein YcgN (CxxCxxCC family)